MIRTTPARLALAGLASFTLAMAGPADGMAQDEQGTDTGPAKLTSADLFELEYAGDPRISPDGKTVVYIRRSQDIMADRTRSNLWAVASDGGDHRPLLSGRHSYSSPRWSPDGSRIAYISSHEGSPQLYVRWMDTGQTALVTNLSGRPRSISWSPDGRWIAFINSVPAEKTSLAKPPKKPKGAKWADGVKVTDSVIYRFNGLGYLDPAHAHVFVVPADGGTPRQLTDGAFNHGGRYSFSGGTLSWTADSAAVVFSANRNENWEYETIEADVYAAPLDGGALRRITDAPGAENGARMSPDGRRIAYIASENNDKAYRTARLVVADSDGGNPRVLTADLDRSVGGIRWAANGRGLYFTYDDRGMRQVAYSDLGGKRRIIAGDVGGTSLGRPYVGGSFTVADDGTVAYSRTRPDRPADVAVTDGRRARTLTALNEDLLAHRALGQVHEITYASTLDGTEIQGWYVTPPDFDPAKQYPLVLELHGGPHSAYGPHFSAEIQRYAAEGYVVFYDNYRGSTSYGEDFALLLQYKYSSRDDFTDHMSGIDALIARGFVDPDQLFITGGSAGGIASAYAIGLTDRFKAAAVAKPVINWLSKTLMGDIYMYQIKHQFPGMPWEALEHYWQRSPLSLVGNVTTPTLLITGEADYRTPIAETEQFYQALKLRKVDTVMVRVPGASHGIAARPSHLIAKVDNILAWFDRYRTPDATESTGDSTGGSTAGENTGGGR